MASYNKTVLIGNLCTDVELRYVGANKTPVCDLRLAVNEKSGEREDTLYIDVTAWNKQAELCSQYLSKGRSVLVEGRLKLDTWEKDGEKRSKICVVADRVVFMSNGGRPEGTEAPAEAVTEKPKRTRKKAETEEEAVPF